MVKIEEKLLVLLVIISLVCFGAGYKYGAYRQKQAQAVIKQIEGWSEKEEGEKKEKEKSEIYVYVVGEVKNPGVYRLISGERVFRAVEMAEPTGEADLTQVNMAALANDGDMLYIPKKGEVGTQGLAAIPQGPAGIAQSRKVNINTASVSELDERLPGIGPALAQRIVDFRNTKGPFARPEDICQVPGIGEKRFEQIKDLICVR